MRQNRILLKKKQKIQKLDSFWEAYGTIEILDDIFDNHKK